MRRPIKRNRLKLAAESQRLVNLSLAVAQSASRMEDLAWQEKLDLYVAKNLKQHHQDILDAAAENLFASHPNGYEVLVETLETISTSAIFEVQGHQYYTLLIAAPILAWTRFEISSGSISVDALASLSHQLSTQLLVDQAKLRLLPNLYSIDQLPRNHTETYALMERQAMSLLKNSTPPVEAERAQTVPFLADIRYLLAVLVTPIDAPLFQWQALDAPYDCVKAKSAALLEWQQQVEPTIKNLLPGCGIELLLPEAYYTACREADIKIRPASIRSAVFYLTQTLGKEANQFEVVIAACGVQETPGQIDEFRISFCLVEAPEVIYGVVWPLYQAEDQLAALGMDDTGQVNGDIPEILTECGIVNILQLEEIFAMEFCDDCGTPLFADREAELVHPEMPEDTPTPGTAHFH
ncbi:DUF2863 family protein [Undibacterium sp. SXout20W]|uniref:DUF2863 family protein n=1 Tax=Undibacterium sp. SXout20W TaxID=3413051 RepID=UPI003BF0D7D1